MADEGDRRQSVTPQPPDDTTNQSRSPIRPTGPVDKGQPPQLVPDRPPAGLLGPSAGRSGDATPEKTETESNPEDALERLRQRMTQVAEEFAAGKLNRAQFHAIYNRYSERRRIIEQLISRDPGSQAWQQVARPGHTSFLREHFAARVLYFALYPLGRNAPIVQQGEPSPPPEALLPILRVLPDVLARKGRLAPARRQLQDGHWLVVAPGQHTVSIFLFSLEPSAQQLAQIDDLHQDFERANAFALSRRDYTPRRLVFPQRALFEV